MPPSGPGRLKKASRTEPLIFQNGAELGVDGGEVAGVDAGSPDGSKEIGIVGPTGDDMDVKVAGHARAGGGAEVEADIEALWLHRLAESPGHAIHQGPEVGGLLVGECREVVHLAVGADHEVAKVVGKAVEDGEGGFGAGEDKVSRIIRGVGQSAKKIFTGFFLAGDIAVAPRGPEVFHPLTMASAAKQGKPQHLLVGGGDEPEVSRRARELFQEWAPDDAMNAEKVDGRVETVDAALQAIAKTREALETLPFLGGRKLVWLTDATFLGDNPAGRSEGVLDALKSLQELLEKIPASEAQLLVSAPGVDKRRSFFRQFEKLGQVEVFDPPDLRRGRDRGDWMDEIAARMRQAGLTPGPGAVELLVEIVGWDGRALEREIEKLRLYLKPETKVTEQAVRDIGAGRRELEVWDWCDAVVAGRSGPARVGLRRLLDQGESEVGLVMILASSLRLAALGRALQEARLLRVPPPGSYGQASLDPGAESVLPRNAKGEKPNLWRLGKVTALCAHRPATGVRRALERLHELQIELISGVDRGRALEEGILRLCLD